MNRALFTLILLQGRGIVRRMLRSANSPRRALFTILGCGIIILWLGSALVSGTMGRGRFRGMERSSERFRAVAPVAIAGMCLLTIISSAGDKAIAFTPGEVDILIPGPYSRRELLFYKLAKSAFLAMLTALLMSFGLMVYARFWIACYIGSFLTLLFIQFFSICGVLLAQAAGHQMRGRARQAGVIVAIVLAAVIIRKIVAAHGGPLETFNAFRYSELGTNLLMPFDPFGRTITAYDYSELASSAGEAALIDLGLLTIVVLLDAHYFEAALSASRRRYAQLQRIRGGSLLSSNLKGDISWRLPLLPWAGGAGPIVWRQATSAARSAKGIALMLVIVAVGIGPLMAPTIRDAHMNQVMVGMLAWLTILLSGLLKFDFRGDLDHMDELKALPLRPAALSLGQITVPAMILTGAHVLLLSSVAIVTPSHREIFIVAACLSLPFNALLLAIENLIFLLFPTRPAAASPGDFQVLGRQAAQLIMKGIAVSLGFGIALAVAIPLYIVTKGSLLVLTTVAGSLLAIEAGALVPAIAWAFARFDPSVDTPA
jgi:hypothetical protein